MEVWLKDRLSNCLDFEVPDIMIDYIVTIKDDHEVDEYFKTLLNFELPEHILFLNDFKQRLNRKNQPLNENRVKKPNNNKPLFPQKKDKSKSNIEEAMPIYTGTKKKTKFVSIYGQDGQVNDIILLKGRHHCNCQASKHKLVTNCINCGRIICEQEGSGPCLFCGSLVCTEDEQKLIDSSTRKGESLKKSLMEQNRPKGWEEALAQRNRLLEYDKNSEKRTTVIDDESDYFKTNSVWLSDSERKKLERLENELREKKHASRLTRKVTLDFAGRRIVEEPELTYEFEDEILREIAASCSRNNGNVKLVHDKTDANSDTIHPGIKGPAPVFDNGVTTDIVKKGKSSNAPKFDGVYNRVQDKEFLEMSDLCNCMSMHQPWASLLIAGIKKHEGRTWYSSHRGRLWIASTAKPLDVNEVKQMEQFYSNYYNDETIEFPSQYPAACLLGCVSVDDCLPQEEYRKQYPNGESQSPFVFICSDFQELPIRFPNKGEPKIYKLDPQIHQAAIKALQRLSKLKAEE